MFAGIPLTPFYPAFRQCRQTETADREVTVKVMQGAAVLVNNKCNPGHATELEHFCIMDDDCEFLFMLSAERASTMPLSMVHFNILDTLNCIIFCHLTGNKVSLNLNELN